MAYFRALIAAAAMRVGGGGYGWAEKVRGRKKNGLSAVTINQR